MKKIVVFGATGNIGVYFIDYCLTHLDLNEYQVIAVGRKNTDLFKKMGVDYYKVDLCSEEDFSVLPTTDLFAVVNLAGILPAYKQVVTPFEYIDVNITGAIRIMEYARKNNADRIIYSHTWADLTGYFGKTEVLSPNLPRKLPYKGDHAFYAISKTMICETMQYYQQEFGIKSFIFRLPNIYLYSPIKSYYVNGAEHPISYRYLIDRAISGEDIEVWGNPNAFKDLIYIKDFCQMLCGALVTDVNGGLYHAGTGVKTTLIDHIEGIISVFSPSHRKPNLIFKPEKPSIKSFVMDIENAKKDLNYIPKYSCIEYLKDYKDEMNKKRFDSLWV